jgi:hypothetical protein
MKRADNGRDRHFIAGPLLSLNVLLAKKIVVFETHFKK